MACETLTPLTVVERARFAMGTLLTIRVESPSPKAAGAAVGTIFDGVRELERRWSRFQPASEIRTGRHSPVTHEALEMAAQLSRETDGFFDPFTNGVDLGAIGKGLAADRAVALAASNPAVSRLSMDFGGQLTFWDRDGALARRLTIEVADWTSPPLALIIQGAGTLSVSSQSERPGHVRNPLTGRPASHWRQALVWSPQGAAADAWSTALLAAGPERLRRPARELTAWVVPWQRDVVLDYPWKS